jgi:hypothetical protein
MEHILKSCDIEIKVPKSCTDKELYEFYSGLKKGGKVSLNGLKERINNCELLAFCRLDNQLIGLSAIKRPGKHYVEEIIQKANLNIEVMELTFEIGYSFTEPEFRMNGISKTLKESLLKEMESRKGIIFSTTAVLSSQNFLKKKWL